MDKQFLRTFVVTVALGAGTLALFGAFWLLMLLLTGGPLTGATGCGFSCGAGSSVSHAPGP